MWGGGKIDPPPSRNRVKKRLMQQKVQNKKAQILKNEKNVKIKKVKLLFQG